MDIASLGVRLDTAGVVTGGSKLDDLKTAAREAEQAIESLEASSQGASGAVAEVGQAATDASKSVSAMETTTAELAAAEEKARDRIREMVRASLDNQRAMVAAAAATRDVTRETSKLAEAQSGGRGDVLGSSYAESQRELEALSDAMAHQAQSLDDIGERRAWVNDLYERGLISIDDTASHLKTLDSQERSVQSSIAAHAKEVENLLRTYDPASIAIERIIQDERKLEQALKEGAITRTQYTKALAGLQVSKAGWQAESAGIQATAKNLNLLALSSGAAFRDYGQLISAIGRGDFQTASNQVLQLGVRTGALRYLFSPLGLAIAAVVAATAGLTKAMFDAQNQTYELQRSVILSGAAAGVSAGKIALMAESLDNLSGITRTQAVEALTQLTATGNVSGESLERFAEAALQLKSKAGQPIEETVRNLSELGREPVEASIRLNRQYNYLTEEILDQIAAYKQQGEFAKASLLAQNAYVDANLQRTKELSGYLPPLAVATKAVTGAFREMWEAVTGEFVEVTPEQMLKRMQEARGNRPLFGGRAQFDMNLFVQDQQEEELAKQIAARDKRLADQSAKARELRDKQEAQTVLSQRLQLEKSISDAVSSSRASNIQRELNNSLSQYAAYEAQLEAEREAGLISEETYYAEKRKLIEQNRNDQIEALQLESRRLAAESDRVRSAARAESANATPQDRSRIEAQAQIAVIGNQSKIADNEAQIAILRGKAIADLNVLTTQQEAANRAITKSYEDAKSAAEAYLQVLRQQQERELAAFGQGGRARERNETRNRIDDRFADQRLQLESDKRSNPKMTQQQYEQQLQIINDSNRQALESDQAYWSKREELESNFYVGAQEAAANYLDEARNVAKQSENLFTNAFQSMEDALVGFVQTGKLDFKSLADSIIADLIRIQLRTLAMNALGGSGSGGFLGSLLGLLGGAVGGTGAGGGSIPTAGSAMFADTGIMRVPRDNQPVILHKDEAVLPARMNPWAGGQSPWGGSNLTINSVVNAAPGTNVAQLQAVLDQRDAALEAKIATNLYRGRWAAVSA